MARVQLKNVEKTFNKNKVLKGINVEVPDGSFMVMVGPSGCGKSTALRCIAGLEEVTGGSIFIGDEDVTSKEPKGSQHCDGVPELRPLPAHERVRQHHLRAQGARASRADERKRRAEDAAKLLGLDGLLDRMPKQLSGGQRQRVAMGRAIVREPSVFLFDEPLSNLDANLRNQMRIELRRLHQRLATTSIYVTHDQVEAMTLAEKILVLRAGNIEQYGTPDDIYLHPASVFVAQFMGSPSMNMIPATTDGEKLILPDGTPLSGVAASDIRLAAAPSRTCSSACAAKTCCSIPKVPCRSPWTSSKRSARTRWLTAIPSQGKRAVLPIRAPSSCVFPGTRRPAPGDAIRLSVRAGHGHVFDPASGLRCL